MSVQPVDTTIIGRMGSAVEKAADLLENVAMTICWILLAVLVAVVFGQVISRYVLKTAMLWSQEAALFCFAWTSFLGAGVALRRKRHFVFNIIPEENIVAQIVSQVGIVIVAWVYFYYGLRLALRNWNILTQPSGLRLGYFLASIPAAGLLFLVFFLEDFLGRFRKGGRAH